MKRYYYIIVLLLILSGVSNRSDAQDAPVLLCANVLADGTVDLTWEIPNPLDPNEEYDFYWFSPDNGWFNIEAGFDVSDIPYNHIVDATLSSQQYLIQSVINGVPGAVSDTISTIYLEVSPVPDTDNSVADLTWNSPFSNMPVGSQYKIHRNMNGMGNEIIALVDGTVTTYRDTLYGLCTDGVNVPVEYRVEFENSTCTMSSQVVIDNFTDLLGPNQTQVETVLVDPFSASNDVIIYWYPSTAPDLEYYRIQRSPDFIPVGIVPGDQPTTFIYQDASELQATSLVVIPHDTCGIVGNEESFSEIYTTMFAQSQYQNCASTAELWWNPYEGWAEGVSHYRLHIQSNGGAFDVFDNLDANQVVFTLETVPNLDYCYYVEAISNGTQRPSTSNMNCFTAAYPEPITDNYLSRVTTISQNEIQIDLYQDPSGVGTTYELMRSVAGSSFHLLYTHNVTPEEIYTYSDFDVDSDVTIYSYKWLAYDGCGQALEPDSLRESNTSENIVLVPGTSSEDLINTLEWNPYVGWDGEVQEYEIHRKLGSELDFTLHATVGPSVTTWQEDVESYMLEEGLFCYKIVAIENNNAYDKPAESTSSEACAVQEPLMWVPNTIVVNGFNTEFVPVAGFIDFSSYEMEIINRGGTQLFYTDDIGFGWTGTYQGRDVKEDYYMYTITYQDGAGQHYLKRGELYVLHAEKQ